MEIAKLGEFGLIDRLTQDIKPQNTSTKYGAVVAYAVLGRFVLGLDILREAVYQAEFS